MKIKHEVEAWPIFVLAPSWSTAKEFNVFFHEILLLVMFTLHISGTIAFYLKRNGGVFFTYPWNWVDILITVLFILYLSVKITAFMNVVNETNLEPYRMAHPEKFMPFVRALKADVLLAKQLLGVGGGEMPHFALPRKNFIPLF